MKSARYRGYCKLRAGITDIEVERIGHAPSVAVDDTGHVTLLYGEQPDILAVRRFTGGALVHRADLHIEPLANASES